MHINKHTYKTRTIHIAIQSDIFANDNEWLLICGEKREKLLCSTCRCKPYSEWKRAMEGNTQRKSKRKRDRDLPGKIQNSIEFRGVHFEWPALRCTTNKSPLTVCISTYLCDGPLLRMIREINARSLRAFAVRAWVRAYACLICVSVSLYLSNGFDWNYANIRSQHTSQVCPCCRCCYINAWFLYQRALYACTLCVVILYNFLHAFRFWWNLLNFLFFFHVFFSCNLFISFSVILVHSSLLGFLISSNLVGWLVCVLHLVQILMVTATVEAKTNICSPLCYQCMRFCYMKWNEMK